MIKGALSDMVPLPVSTPGAATTGAIDSDWVGLKEYAGVVFCVVLTEGRAAANDDLAITFRQAKSAAGADAKAFTPRRAFVREHATDLPSAAAADPVVVDPVPASGIATNGDMSRIVLVEIDAAELDVNDDFAYVQARTPAVSSSTSVVGMTAIPCGAFHKLAPQHMRSPLG